MFLFRSLAIGLLGACCLLLAMRPRPLVVTTPAPVVVVPRGACALDEPDPPAAPPVTIVDVAPGVTGALLTKLVVLAPNEHVVSIDDAPVRDGATALASLEPSGRHYIDVIVATDAGATRRVLVLAR